MASDEPDFMAKLKAEAEARKARSPRVPRGNLSDSTPIFDMMAKQMAYSGSVANVVIDSSQSSGIKNEDTANSLKPAMKKSSKLARRVTFSESNIFHDGGVLTPDDDPPLPDLHFDTSTTSISAPQSWSYEDFISSPPKFQANTGPMSGVALNDVFNKLQNLYVADDSSGGAAPVNESSGFDSFSIDEVMKKLTALSFNQEPTGGDDEETVASHVVETTKRSSDEASSSSSSLQPKISESKSQESDPQEDSAALQLPSHPSAFERRDMSPPRPHSLKEEAVEMESLVRAGGPPAKS